MKSRTKIIIVSTAVVTIAAAVLFFTNKKRATEPTNTEPQKTSAPGSLPSLQSTPKNTNNNSPSALEQPANPPASPESQAQIEYSYDILQNNPAIIDSVRKTKGDFKINDIGTSFPSAEKTLENGDSVLILSGCTPHNCGGTENFIAYNKKDNNAYLLVEKVSSSQGFEIFGNPSKEIRDLLISHYRNK